MLQIHLNKSSSGGGGAAAAVAGGGGGGGGGSSAGDGAAAAVSATSSASASETNPNIIINNSSSSNNNNNINMNNNNNNNSNNNSNVTVSCAEHLVLADLLVAKGLGTPPSTHSQSKPPRKKSTVGRKRPRTAGTKTHICVCCDFPIAIYGRLIPCHHAFCLTCARSEPTCYLCDQRIQKIVSIKLLDGLFICGAPHCLKSFLKKYDFEQHLKESHIDLLQPASEKQEKDVVSTIPPAPDAHYKPQLHAESQALSRLVAAPVNQGSQQVTVSADSPSMRSLLKRSSNSMSVVPPPMQKQILGSQSTVAPIPTSATPPYEKQVLPNHMSAIKIPEQSFDKKQMEYSESQLLAPVQSFEKQSLQSTHTHYQRQASETHQSPQQQTERRQVDAFSQQNQGTSLGHVARGMPANHTANMPQYGSQPYSHPYSISSEGKQHMGSSFDPRYGSAKSTNFHSSIQNMQENNQRYPVQTQFVPQFQDNQHITQQVGGSMFPNSASASISNPPPHEGYMYLDRQTRVSNNQGDVGQVPGVLQAHFPQPYSEVHSLDISQVPLPKHRHYPNLANHANNAANHGWNAARTNYGGHGYGNWMGQSGN